MQFTKTSTNKQDMKFVLNYYEWKYRGPNVLSYTTTHIAKSCNGMLKKEKKKKGKKRKTFSEYV